MTLSSIDAKISPMMQQWHDCKAKAHDALVLFRLGDFYEAFYEDAATLSAELEVTLTQRQEIPMAGIPVHTAEGYIDKLIAKGFKVAVAEQMEDPKKTKGIVARKIVRTITPGTLVSSSLLSEKSHNFIVCLHQINLTLALAALDLTTGECKAIELESFSSCHDELIRLMPRELLICERLLKSQKLFFEQLKEDLSITLTMRPDWYFDEKAAHHFLLKHFKLHSLDSFGIEGCPSLVICSGALISYVQNDLFASVDHITEIHKEKTSQYMSLDASTQRHLELTSSSSDKKGGHTLLHLLDNTATAMGARLLSQWITHPLLEPGKIKTRQDVVHFFYNLKKNSSLYERLKKIKDLERLLIKIQSSFAGPRDLQSLGLSLQAVPEAIAVFKEEAAPEPLLILCKQIEDLSSVAEKIIAALNDELPMKIADGHIFRQGYSSELDELRQIRTCSHEWVVNYQMRLREDTGIKTLKVGYTRAFGYYIEVSRGQAEKMPGHFERRQTLVNAERFLSAELKDFEYKILTAEERIKQIESELFASLCQTVCSYSSSIKKIASAIAQIDCFASLASAALCYNFTCPVIDDSSTLSIKEGRHPVIEATLKGESFIANDLDLGSDDKKLYIITGPNMAGKSTYIRQVALIVIMAQIGSFVPAQSAHIGVVDKVFTRIGASDNLSRGQSTFMVEMTETAHILNNATNRSLVILDEIGRGTSTYDGISIAWAVAEYLLTTPEKMAKTLFATHYCEMTELEGKIPGALNYHVAVHENEKGIIFLRKIVRGGTDKSYGIHVARLAGLPYPVIRKAQQVLKTLEEKEKKEVSAKKNKDSSQLSLFTDIPAKEPAFIKDIQEIDPNNLTPMQALQKMIDWKKLYG